MGKQQGGNSGTQTPAMPGEAVEGVDQIVTAAHEFSEQTGKQKSDIVAKLWAAVKAKNEEVNRLHSTLIELGETVPTNGTLAIDGPRRRRRRGPNKIKGIDGRSGPRAGRKAKAGKAAKVGKARLPRPGTTTEKVWQLVKKYAPTEGKAMTAADILSAKKKDAKFRSLSDTQVNSGLQANRAPKMQNARLAMTDGPNGGARGGKYYAIV